VSVVGLYFVLIASVAVAWLARQGVFRSNWLEEGELAGGGAVATGSGPRIPAAKVGLAVFLVVAGFVFSLLAASFFIRMESPDWQAPPLPGVLWFNTAALLASSAGLQLAVYAARRHDIERLRTLLLAGAVFAGVFFLGQLWAWRDLVASGYFASSNPANAFFYLMTGVHAAHLLGGLVALARTCGKAFAPSQPETLATSVELCAVYWHFLLFVWLLLFVILAGGADGLGALCRRILS
jgi:cytochrome c oxidase subunit 3